MHALDLGHLAAGVLEVLEEQHLAHPDDLAVVVGHEDVAAGRADPLDRLGVALRGATGPPRPGVRVPAASSRASAGASARTAGRTVTVGLDHSSSAGVGRHQRVDHVDDGRVRERRHVAELTMLGDVAQQPAHDLARARLRAARA